MSVVNGCILSSPFRNLITCIRLSAAYTSMPSTTDASPAFPVGSIIPLYPSSFAFMVMGSAPFMGITAPSSPSSPIIR